jgi:hypothetical protein
MKIKSLALVAAAVMTAGAAQAADLNKPAKVAVDYVKVCDAYGAGFFYIPGSDTCLQLSGYARETFVVGNSRNLSTNATPYYLGLAGARNVNSFASFTQAEFDVDARTNTSFGLLRSYISLDVNYNSGVPVSGGTSVVLNRGFLQWGGLTAGRIESNFTFFQGYNEELYFSELAPDYQVNALSYTFSFGNGVTALIGIEDGSTSTRTQGGPSFAYQGNKVPDIVANINVTQAWGSAQISGAAHNVYGLGTLNGGGNVNVNRWGYAVLGGVWFNIPTLGAGDKIGFQASYASGALQYTSAGEVPTAIKGSSLGTDLSVLTTGQTKLGTTWNIYSSFVHNFTPTVSLAVGGGVQGQTNYNSAFNDKNTYTVGSVGSTLFWTPVKGMLIDLSVEYQNLSFNGAAKNELGLRNGDAWVTGLRFKRSF